MNQSYLPQKEGHSLTTLCENCVMKIGLFFQIQNFERKTTSSSYVYRKVIYIPYCTIVDPILKATYYILNHLCLLQYELLGIDFV